MPSSERPDMKKGGESERLIGEKGEEGGEEVRRGERGLRRMPSLSTTSGHSKPNLKDLINRMIWRESSAIRDVFTTALTGRERLPGREQNRKEHMSCPSNTAHGFHQLASYFFTSLLGVLGYGPQCETVRAVP